MDNSWTIWPSKAENPSIYGGGAAASSRRRRSRAPSRGTSGCHPAASGAGINTPCRPISTGGSTWRPSCDASASSSSSSHASFAGPRFTWSGWRDASRRPPARSPSCGAGSPRASPRCPPPTQGGPARPGRERSAAARAAAPATVGEACFTYLAAVEVETLADVPDGMLAVTITANTYAVVTHTGHISRLPDTVRHVWGRWLPASRYRHVPAPDFELYDPVRWDPGTGDGDVDLYVPVAEC